MVEYPLSLGSLTNHKGDTDESSKNMILYCTYESRDNLKSFTLFNCPNYHKSILEHSDKFEIKI